MEYSSQGTAICASETKEGTFKKLYGFYQFPDMGGDTDKLDVTNFNEMNPIKVHPKKFYSTFCGSRMFLFSASPFSRNL